MAKAAAQRAAARPGVTLAWRFPEALVGRGTRLLTQQCWYWGCDVRRPAGNLLIAHGFTRTRPPADVAGSTLYTYTPAPETQIVLWSFGVFIGRESCGGLFLERFRFEPYLLETSALPPSIWQQQGLPPLHRPREADRARTAALLSDLIAWIVAYEEALPRSEGAAYREACLRQWSRQRLALPADRLIPGWRALADGIATDVDPG
ncbi:MAG: hypothetical protein OHK0015_07530 [Chloroflexi bacterium OHK40]